MVDINKILFLTKLFLTKQYYIRKEEEKEERKGNIRTFHRMIKMGNCQSNIWVMEIYIRKKNHMYE